MISVYADGSSTGMAVGPGGFGWAIVVDCVTIDQGHGGAADTTNNRMEISAAIYGLKVLVFGYPHLLCDSVELVSDSQYTLGIANGAYNPKKNLDLAAIIRQLFVDHPTWTTRWVRGHTGDHFNEIVDKLAKKGKEEALATIQAIQTV